MLSGKRGTEDLDYFIGDEALAASSGPGYGLHYPIRHGQIENWVRIKNFYVAASSRLLICVGPNGALLVQLDIQVPPCRARGPPLPPD